MYLIQQITNEALQRQTLILPDGTQMTMTINFKPMQYGWFITELVYKDFTLTNIRICTSPNIIYQFKNKLPFGIACFTKDNGEPTQSEDFLSGRSLLYLLSEAEVNAYTEILSGEISP